MRAETWMYPFVLLVLWLPATRTAADAGWLKATVEPDSETGLPARIVAPGQPGRNLLVGPAALAVSEDGKDLPAPTLAKTGPRTWAADLREQNLRLELTYGSAMTAFIELALTSQSGKPRTVSCRLSLPLLPLADRAFFPAGEKPTVILVSGQPAVTYGYQSAGTWTAMPLGQVYSEEQDRGLAVFGEIGLLVEPMMTTVSHSEQQTLVEVTLAIPLGPEGHGTRRLHLAVTAGDWRPALGAVLAAFPQAFEPQNAEVAALHGPFVCSGGTPPNEQIEDWYAQGCRAVEIHCTFPFYGEYVPTRELWTPLVDDQWHSLKQSVPTEQRPSDDASWEAIRDFVEQHNPPTMTKAAVNDYLDRLHQHGMKGFIYFNPTEAWAPWAAATFPDDRRLGPGGKPIPAWYESCSMIPDRNRPWGKYLLEQVRGELAIYPKVDGVFFDQSAGGDHDLTELCAEACRLVRARGGICWWNGPYNMELAGLADGMMTEGGGSETYRQPTEIIQYYGLAGKPIVSLGAATDAGYAEMLIHGVTPQPVGRAEREVGERWFPLFRWLRNRRWVLEAHALEAPPEVIANLYRTPEGNLVVPIVRSPIANGQAGAVLGVPIAIRAPEAADVRAAYLLAPDLRGYHKLPFSRTQDGRGGGSRLQVTVPRLGPAALLVLAKTGVFPAVEGGLCVVQGTRGTVRLTFDNWTPEPVRLGLSAPTGAAEQARDLVPGRTLAVDCPLEAPAQPGQRMIVPCSAKLDGVEVGPMELWVDPPLVILADGPPDVRDDGTLTVRVRLLGHLPKAAKARVGAAGEGWRFGSPAEVGLEPERVARLDLTGRPAIAGETTVTVSVRANEGVSATTTLPVRVLATALAPGGFEQIRAAELLMGVFGSDSGLYEHKPVAINGVEIGNVPQGSGDAWAEAKALPLPPAAVRGLREHNEITIDNAVGDAFKVRDLRLIVHLRGGITAVSSVNRGVYTGWKDWLYSEGTTFESGQPMTGIKVDIPIDPRRQERYEEFFGTPKNGSLVLEINGSDAGPYAHKPVSINGCVIGDLPSAGDWTEQALALTPEALASLRQRNEVTIENSEPPDAFKVRRARIEVENTEGRRFDTDTDNAAYTSVGWEFAEGTVGSPIRIELRFGKG